MRSITYLGLDWSMLHFRTARPILGMTVLAIILVFPISRSTCAQPESFGSNDPALVEIANGIRQSLSRFSSLRMRYTCSSQMWVDGKRVPVWIEGKYAHKYKEGSEHILRHFDVTIYTSDPNNTRRDILESRVVSFNGKATIELVRVDRLGLGSRCQPGLMRGYVQKGLIHGAFVFDGGDFGPFKQVWYLGRKDLATGLLSSDIGFRVVGKDRWEGLEVDVIEGLVSRRADDPNSRAGCFRFWVCPQKGYLPVRRTVIIEGRVASDHVLQELTELAEGLWFPRRIESVSRVWQVQEISLEPIPDSFFTFEFPAGTRVYDEVEGINYTTY